MVKKKKCKEESDEETSYCSWSETTTTPSMLAYRESFQLLMNSVIDNDLDGVKRAIDEGANKDELLERGTALFHFCLEGNIAAIQWLLEEKADVNIPDVESGEPCLMVLYRNKVSDSQKLNEVIDREFLDTAQLLINSRADINKYGYCEASDHGGHAKWSFSNVLHVAAMKFQEPYCRQLINSKADIHSRQTEWITFGRNVLHWACLAPYPNESNEVISKMSYLYKEHEPCVSTRSADYLRFLIASGADVDTQGFDGKTALCLAAERGWLEGVKALMETPMPRQQLLRSSKISTIMHSGSKWGIVKVVAEEIVDLLIRSSADPSIDSNKPFIVMYPDPTIERHNRLLHVEDESDEEEEVIEEEGRIKVQSMLALVKKKVNPSTIDDRGSHSGDLVGQCQKKLCGSEQKKCALTDEPNLTPLVKSTSPTSRSSCSENEDKPMRLVTRRFNQDWDETCEDGTALAIAKKHNHVDIIEYLSRFT